MQRAFGKSAYKTVILLTILTFGIVFATFTVSVNAVLTLPTLSKTEGNVGDDDLIVSGGGANPFTLVEIYWDGVEEEDLLTKTSADQYGDYETDDEDIVIPDDVAGNHTIVVVNQLQTNVWANFTILPEIDLDPAEGLPDDRIEVSGTGFGGDEDLTVFFDYYGWTDEIDVDGEDVTRGDPETSATGNFTTTFDVPDVDDDQWPIEVTVYANDSAGNFAMANFTVGEYIHVDPDEGYPTWGPVDWEARAEPNTDYEVVFVGEDLWISIANVTSDDDGFMDGTFFVPYESEPGPGPTEPNWGNEYTVELWDAVDDPVAGEENIFTVYPYPELLPEHDGARANETVGLDGVFFSRVDDTEVTVTLDGVEIDVFDTDEFGMFNSSFEVPNLEYGHYTLYAVDENGYEAEADFDIRPEGWEDMGTRQLVYFQGDHISFWANTTWPDDTGDDLLLFVNITDSEGVLFWDPYCQLGPLYYNFWCVDQVIEGEFNDFYVLAYCEQPWKMMLPDDAPVGTWSWTAYETNEGSYDEDTWDVFAEGEFEVVAKLTLDLVLDRLDEMEATIAGLFSDTEGNLMAYIDTKAGTLTASLADLNAKVVEVEGDTATLVTDLGMVKADVADIADEFPIDIPTVDLTPMWAAVALSLVAAIAAIAAVVVVYQRIA
jgi:hypothetical protein